MKSVLSLSSSRWALLAAFGLAAASYTPAAAADLGGDCCADLEERVAELEATTARKGNRKVSLTVSGWVNEMVMWWDDGTESNVYVGTNKLEQSRVRFVGEAQIVPGWSAGYTLEIGILGANASGSSGWNQINPDGTAGTTNVTSVRKSSWFIKSKDLGKVTVGQDATALYHLLDDADFTNTRNVSDAEAAAVYQGNFGLRHNGAFIGGAGVVGGTQTGTASIYGTKTLTWAGQNAIMQGIQNSTDGQDGRRNVVRYDSPTFAGFTATASWGEDDDWGMMLSYANTWFNDFKVKAQAGYGEVSDENIGCSVKNNPTDCQIWGAAATVMHVPTGLYVYGGYGQQFDQTVANLGLAGTHALSDMWFIQGGIEQKWWALGKTTIFGEYRQDNGGSKAGVTITNVSATQDGVLGSSNTNFWAAGVVQEIEPAAMQMYLMYRHADGEIANLKGVTTNLDAFDSVIGGARIQF